MSKNFPTVMALSSLLILGTAGCGHKKPANTETQIDQASNAMAQAEAPQPTESAPTTAPAPVQQMNDALAAYKSGNYTDAVTRFQTMRAHTAMSGAQLTALNRAMAAVMSDLYARAAKGDAQAQQAIEEYQRLQNGPQR